MNDDFFSEASAQEIINSDFEKTKNDLKWKLFESYLMKLDKNQHIAWKSENYSKAFGDFFELGFKKGQILGKIEYFYELPTCYCEIGT